MKKLQFKKFLNQSLDQSTSKVKPVKPKAITFNWVGQKWSTAIDSLHWCLNWSFEDKMGKYPFFGN